MPWRKYGKRDARAASRIQLMFRKKRMRRNIARGAYSKIRRVPLALKPHTFVERSVVEGDLTPNGTGYFRTFQLDDIYNKVSYQKIFEYYTINKVIVTFRYKAAGDPRRDLISATAGTVNEANPMLWFKVDHNDITADTLSVMKASSRTRTFQFTNDKPELSITIRPAVLDEVYKSSIASTYVPVWKQKLTTADLTVPHYGLKAYATSPTPSQAGSIYILTKYYFTMKNNE